MSAHLRARPLAGGYSLKGLPQAYTPGKKYNLTLQGDTAGYKGFMLMLGGGSFSSLPSGAKALSGSSCTGAAATHRDSSDKNGLEFEWTAPMAGSGTISTELVALQEKQVWYELGPSEIAEASSGGGDSSGGDSSGGDSGGDGGGDGSGDDDDASLAVRTPMGAWAPTAAFAGSMVACCL